MAARAWQKAPGVVQILGLGVAGWCGCGPTTTWAQDGVAAPLRRGWGGAKDREGVSFLAHGAQSAANMRSDHRVSSFPSSC